MYWVIGVKKASVGEWRQSRVIAPTYEVGLSRQNGTSLCVLRVFVCAVCDVGYETTVCIIWGNSYSITIFGSQIYWIEWGLFNYIIIYTDWICIECSVCWKWIPLRENGCADVTSDLLSLSFSPNSLRWFDSEHRSVRRDGGSVGYYFYYLSEIFEKRRAFENESQF